MLSTTRSLPVPVVPPEAHEGGPADRAAGLGGAGTPEAGRAAGRPVGAGHGVGRRCWSVFLVGVTVAVGAGLGVGAAPARADVAAQLASTRVRLASLQVRAEAAAERYDAGRITWAAARLRVAAAQAVVARQDKVVAGLRVQAGAFAADAYMAGPAGQGIAILGASSPERVLGQLGTLNRISRSQADVLAGLAVARSHQAAAARDARTAWVRADRSMVVLRAERRSVELAAVQAQRLLGQLQVQQAAVVRAARDAAAQQAARAQAAALAVQAARNAAALVEFRAQPLTVAQPVATPTAAAPVAGAAQVAVQVAMSQLGKPYVWGAAGPDSFDCSGLTMFAYSSAGIGLPHFTGGQYAAGRHVGRAELQPGDLVFFEASLGHMGMYIGNGQFVHAPHTGEVVRVDSLTGWFSSSFAGAVRVTG